MYPADKRDYSKLIVFLNRTPMCKNYCSEIINLNACRIFLLFYFSLVFSDTLLYNEKQ